MRAISPRGQHAPPYYSCMARAMFGYISLNPKTGTRTGVVPRLVHTRLLTLVV
jgi:hypothetical protein